MGMRFAFTRRMRTSLFLAHLPARIRHSKLFSDFLAMKTAPTLRSVCDKIHLLYQDQGAEITDAAMNGAASAVFKVQMHGMQTVDYWDAAYPISLRNIKHPPWVLFYFGRLPSPEASLAIVGTRKPDEYGIEVVRNFVTALNVPGIQVISGLARGIDSIAHYWANVSNIPNFAILGTGLDEIYPAENKSLADRIQKLGGILSEFPPGTKPLPQHFPWRNRIISGLATHVWIVQGTMRSGSLHTAHHALEQGKNVLVTPGNIFNKLSEVPNRLLFEGAQPLLSVSDLEQILSGSRMGFAQATTSLI